MAGPNYDRYRQKMLRRDSAFKVCLRWNYEKAVSCFIIREEAIIISVLIVQLKLIFCIYFTSNLYSIKTVSKYIQK